MLAFLMQSCWPNIMSLIQLILILKKINMISQNISPIIDKDIEQFLLEKKLRLKATLDPVEAYKNANFIIISTPTNYDPQRNYFDTHCVDEVINDILHINKNATIVIKSTLPVGYTFDRIRKYKKDNILFSLEFLREGNALYDNLYP